MRATTKGSFRALIWQQELGGLAWGTLPAKWRAKSEVCEPSQYHPCPWHTHSSADGSSSARSCVPGGPRRGGKESEVSRAPLSSG